MSIHSEGLYEVAWYLSRFGKEKPPALLGVNSWKDACALFYPSFGEGKNSKEFYNSLKNCRDRFDSWLSDIRIGWRNEDRTPRELPAAYKAAMERMEASSIDQVEQRILSYIAAGDIFEEGRDIQAIKSDLSIDDTTRHQLVAARAGQGWFRSECMKIFPSCPLTGISFTALLRASHIKPWRACQSGFERLDPFNGIMLAVHIDVLFDKGYISFTNSGELLISVELDKDLLQQMKISVTKVPAFSANAHKYLEWHREKLFRG